jgi:hypothetical protein
LILDMSINLGWTPRQVGELTLYQLRIYTSDEKALGGVVKMSGSEYAEYMARKGNKHAVKDDKAPMPGGKTPAGRMFRQW